GARPCVKPSMRGYVRAPRSTHWSISMPHCATPKTICACCPNTIAETICTPAISATVRWATRSTSRCLISGRAGLRMDVRRSASYAPSKHATGETPMTAQPELRPLGQALGTEVLGVDVARLDDETFTWVQCAFAAHPVLVFREQHLSAEALAAFGARFG